MTADTTGTNDSELVRQLEALDSLAEHLASSGGLLNTREQREEGVDLFELLNLWWQEDIHSRLLTWLLDPNGSHDVGDYFLKNFLLHSAGQAADLGTPTISEDRIRHGDWSGATSQREWYTVVDEGSGWLDILVVNERLKTLCAIENKIFSPESGRQLTFYHKALERDYCDFDRHYVFLSPTGMAPQQPEDQSTWTPVSYDAVLELAERTIAEHEELLHANVHALLRQYTNTLRRRIVPVPSDVQKRARETYIANRDAIELVYQHKPDYYAETMQWLREAVDHQERWEFGLETGGYLRFESVDWAEFDRLKTGTAFYSTKELLQFEFRVTNDVLRLRLVLYTGSDEGIRRRIFDAARQASTPFADAGEEVSSRSAILYDSGDILGAEDYAKWDDLSVREKVARWVADFAVNEFHAMNDVIVHCLQGYVGE